MTALTRYAYPEVVLADVPEHVARVKRLASRAGRTFRDRLAHEEARSRLRAYLAESATCHLRFWAGVIMLDPRFCGASGTGAFWAVASRVVNEEARAILAERGRGRPMFEVIETIPAEGEHHEAAA